MFRRFDELNLDAKGRIGLPTRYHDKARAEYEGQFVATVDIRENCLVLYPLPEWEAIEARLDQLPSSQPAFAMLKRRLLGYATDISMDATGRLLLSPELRAFAGLEKTVVLVGQGKKCEIWSKDAWQAMEAKAISADFSSPELAPAIDSLAL